MYRITVLMLAALVIATGCTTTGEIVTASAVNRYCTGATPAEREVIRGRLDTKTAPHQVRIHCQE